MTAMTDTATATRPTETPSPTRDLTKAEVDRFLSGKHITACPVCGRFRSNCDVDVHMLTCERKSSSSTAPVNVLMIVCQNCGSIQFHDRTIIAQWLDCQHKVWVK